MRIQRIYLVRHGETDYNVARRRQGHAPVPLNETGKAQAAALATYFKDVPLDVIYSSTIVRARETAQMIADVKDMRVLEDDRWSEFARGVFEGKTWDELRAEMPEAVQAWHDDDAYAPEGGESRLETQARALAAWQDLTQLDDVETVLVVSHGGALSMLMYKILVNPPERIRFLNTAISLFERQADNSWYPTLFSVTPHLS